MERTAGGSLFHKEGPMNAKDLNSAIEVLTRGTCVNDILCYTASM